MICQAPAQKPSNQEPQACTLKALDLATLSNTVTTTEPLPAVTTSESAGRVLLVTGAALPKHIRLVKRLRELGELCIIQP